MAELKHPSPASSGTAGFFQTPPALVNSFDDDESLRRIFKFYLPASIQETIKPDLSRFGDLVIKPKIRNWCADAERNTPYVKHWDSFGTRIDELVTTSGWQELQKLGIAEGMVALGHDPTHGRYARVHQFVKYHIWTPWNAFVTCPSSMTDGGARLMQLQLAKTSLSPEERSCFEKAREHLLSRDPDFAWTSGQWMTERPGGSDIRNTETQASEYTPSTKDKSRPDTDSNGYPLGPISISGFKWFSSATDANATILLAKEHDGGISAFYAPTRRSLGPNTSETELNGIQIQRMKNKLGTRALPTAELVLSNMRAWRLGKPGQGTKEISTVLSITRIHNAVGSVGIWGRGLAISRAFSKVRETRGRLLMDTPVHVRTLADQHVEYRAMMHLTYYAATLLGLDETAGSGSAEASPCEASKLTPKEAVPHLLRLVTPLAKMLTAKAAIAGLAENMESMGGVGYLENEDPALNIARLFRDANVLSIWEGTTNIMADDLLRILKGAAGPAVLAALDSIVSPALSRWEQAGHKDWAAAVQKAWEELHATITQQSREELGLEGRVLGKELGWLICSVLMAADALSDGNPIATEICSRWILLRERGARFSTRIATLDRAVVFGNRSEMARI